MGLRKVLKKGFSEGGFQKGVSKRCPERPLGEYDPLGKKATARRRAKYGSESTFHRFTPEATSRAVLRPSLVGISSSSPNSPGNSHMDKERGKSEIMHDRRSEFREPIRRCRVMSQS